MLALKWFAQPWALWLLLFVPTLVLLRAWARWRRERALRQLGDPFLVGRLVRLTPRVRRLQALAVFSGVILLIVGSAGPRWGEGRTPEKLTGRDVVVVLDVSRSMLAEQPSRLERARRALYDLADVLEIRGGRRVALVLFAAHAQAVFPLTNDVDHFRFVLDSLDPHDVPSSLRPQSDDKIASGTRMGAALRRGVALHDAGRPGWQDIVLLSDGDDPANDEEWLAGLQDALARRIPVHVMAVGDPAVAHRIPEGGDFLRFGGIPVETRLQEKPLQEIARRTGGVYLPAHTHSLPLGKLLRPRLETGPDAHANDREEDPETARLAEAEPRYAWFLLPGLALLAGSMLAGDGVRRERRAAALAVLAPALLSAAPLPEIEEFIRQGNEAFARQEYDRALAFYHQAEAQTLDPGLVAYNKGVALYRLGKHDEAAAHWRRSLEDDAIPPTRKAKAAYDLGNAIARHAEDDRRLWEQAVAAYRTCLAADPDVDLKSDALHNLELSRWQWLKARAASAEEPMRNGDPSTKQSKNFETKPNGAAANAKKTSSTAANGKGEKNGIEQPGGPDGAKKPAQGPLTVLPDSERLAPLGDEATDALLERIAERVRHERRVHRQQVSAPRPDIRDW